MLTEHAIRQAAEKIAAVAHSPIKVIVFGSYARGQARNDSDLDLLIYSLREFERRANWSSSPVFDAVRHGKVLYERST